jgi:hypothetical protein
MVLDKLRKYPDILQKQVNNKNILLNAIKRNQEQILLQAIILLQTNKPLFKIKIHGLSADSLKEFMFQLNEIINFGPMDESKLRLLDSISRDIMCSTKFFIEINYY